MSKLCKPWFAQSSGYTYTEFAQFTQNLHGVYIRTGLFWGGKARSKMCEYCVSFYQTLSKLIKLKANKHIFLQ